MTGFKGKVVWIKQNRMGNPKNARYDRAEKYFGFKAKTHLRKD